MTLEILLAMALLALAVAMWRVLRSPWHPAVAFPATWSTVLILIVLAQRLGYFPIEPAALVLYVGGAIVFVVGALVGDAYASKRPPAAAADLPVNFNFRRLALVGAFVHALMLPLWWREVTAIVGDSSDLLLLAFQLRYQSVNEGQVVGPLVGNYLVAGFVIVPLLARGVMSARLSLWPAVLVSAPWIATNLITNGRAGLVQLLMVLMYIYLSQGGRLGWKPIVGAVALFVAVFAGGMILVGKSDVEIDDGTSALFGAVVENFLDYVLQGPILFSRYFEEPWLIHPTWDALVFPCSLLEKVGACSPGSQHQEFLDFGSHGRNGNVYSIYLSIYPNYGHLGAAVLLTLYGAWAGFHYRRASNTSSLTHSLLAAYLFSAIPLSIFADYFAPSLNFLIKLVVFMGLLRVLFRARHRSAAANASTAGFAITPRQPV